MLPPGRCSTNCCEWGPSNGCRTGRSGCSSGRTSRRPGEIDKIGILGVDASHLIATIDHNIRQSDTPFFQRKVSYDNLPLEVLPELKKKAADRGQALLESMDRWMSARDRDVTPGVPGTGRKRAGIGIYYFQEDYGEGGEA